MIRRVIYALRTLCDYCVLRAHCALARCTQQVGEPPPGGAEMQRSGVERRARGKQQRGHLPPIAAACGSEWGHPPL